MKIDQNYIVRVIVRVASEVNVCDAGYAAW